MVWKENLVPGWQLFCIFYISIHAAIVQLIDVSNCTQFKDCLAGVYTNRFALH